MNNEKLTPFVQRFLKRWQKNLGLAGWTILWEWCPQARVNTIAGYPAMAVTVYDVSQQLATILVAMEQEWQIERRHLDEYLPSTLLHELVHVRVSGAEVQLSNLDAIFEPYLPSVAAHAVQNASIGVREFYVDTIAVLLLNQEEQCKSKPK